MKQIFFILLLSIAPLSFAALEGYVCEYEYDNKTFSFSYYFTSDHATTHVRFYQEVDLEYVIFDSKGQPKAIEGNPIFKSLTNFGEYSFKYTGTSFYADWNDAWVDTGVSECIVNPDIYF